jgi:SAM-dependent methyltransferase
VKHSEARAYWNARALAHADENVAVETSNRSQRERFLAFLEMNPVEDCSILDVGSGTGSFVEFVRQSTRPVTYVGIDVSEEMVARSAAKYPGESFEVAELLTYEPPAPFDYVACFGTFNIDTEDAEARLPEILSRIFELSSIAGHISLLTDYYPGDLAPHIRSWSPHRVYELAMEVTPYVVLRHDYLPQDFSVTLYHEPLIDRRKRET